MAADTVQVRPARPEEYAEAGRVTALAYSEFAAPGDDDWDGYLAELADVAGRVDRTTVLVAVAGDRVVGCVTLELDDVIGDDDDAPEPGAAHVRMFGVDPVARGRGVGRALMDACLAVARAEGRQWVTLRTTERMTAAQHLYASMGFERDPDRDLAGDDLYLIGFRLRLDD
jgi:ribosomal protein S18 acetylase RimI-like enzyme